MGTIPEDQLDAIETQARREEGDVSKTICFPVTQGLGYEPMSSSWICDEHGIPSCSQGTCGSLPWSNCTHEALLPFTMWADDRHEEIVNEGSDVLPDRAFDAYWPADWFAEVSLRKRQGLPVDPGHDLNE